MGPSYRCAARAALRIEVIAKTAQRATRQSYRARRLASVNGALWSSRQSTLNCSRHETAIAGQERQHTDYPGDPRTGFCILIRLYRDQSSDEPDSTVQICTGLFRVTKLSVAAKFSLSLAP